MNIYPENVLSLAAKYIGYKEKASNKDLYSFEDNAGKGNYTMFQAELDNAKFWNNGKQGFEWCTSFVAWCFWRILGNAEAKRVLCLTGDYGAGCTQWASYYKAAGRLFKTPQVGDQYFQKGSDGTPCHTGIVESVNGNSFVTIEGNASNMVKRVTRNVSSAYGFGRPYYNESEDEEMARYKTIDDVPEWAKPETKELMQLGFNGTGNGVLDVSDDMLRTMIISLRMCKALIAAVPDANIDKDALFEEFKNNLKLSIEIE